MAWTEQIGKNSWRVRYYTGDGRTASIPASLPSWPPRTTPTTSRATNAATPGSTPAAARPPLPNGSPSGSPHSTSTHAPIDNYRSMLRRHILLRWGSTPVNAITALGVNKWIADLHALGYANSTIAGIVKLLSMILTDAADEGLIPANPVRRRRRRGRRSHRIQRERVWATPDEVLRIADQAATLGGDTAKLLIITAAWTGCRWRGLA